jgi:hypothetical protein
MKNIIIFRAALSNLRVLEVWANWMLMLGLITLKILSEALYLNQNISNTSNKKIWLLCKR